MLGDFEFHHENSLLITTIIPLAASEVGTTQRDGATDVNQS